MKMIRRRGRPGASSNVEAAVLGHGKVEGPYTELAGLTVERDPKFPIRITVQFYQATSNGVLSQADVNRLHAKIKKVYGSADYVGSLVVPAPGDRRHTGVHRPTDWTGADLVCLRSYEGTFATNTYFANGYCGLMATSCTGSSFICGSAVFGDYDNLTACPAGTVMLQDSQDVTIGTATATIQNKVCVRACTGTGQCRESETDPALGGQPTQYQCINKSGVQFCYDPRNLSANYTATAY